jgi:hypothetical protein
VAATETVETTTQATVDKAVALVKAATAETLATEEAAAAAVAGSAVALVETTGRPAAEAGHHTSQLLAMRPLQMTFATVTVKSSSLGKVELLFLNATQVVLTSMRATSTAKQMLTTTHASTPTVASIRSLATSILVRTATTVHVHIPVATMQQLATTILTQPATTGHASSSSTVRGSAEETSSLMPAATAMTAARRTSLLARKTLTSLVLNKPSPCLKA